jgi:hypothetical protein
MTEEVTMREEVSATIKRKLEGMEISDEIRQLLRHLLNLELEHAHERGSWHGYKDQYEDAIGKVASRMGEGDT